MFLVQSHPTIPNPLCQHVSGELMKLNSCRKRVWIWVWAARASRMGRILRQRDQAISDKCCHGWHSSGQVSRRSLGYWIWKMYVRRDHQRQIGSPSGCKRMTKSIHSTFFKIMSEAKAFLSFLSSFLVQEWRILVFISSCFKRLVHMLIIKAHCLHRLKEMVLLAISLWTVSSTSWWSFISTRQVSTPSMASGIQTSVATRLEVLFLSIIPESISFGRRESRMVPADSDRTSYVWQLWPRSASVSQKRRWQVRCHCHILQRKSWRRCWESFP